MAIIKDLKDITYLEPSYSQVQLPLLQPCLQYIDIWELPSQVDFCVAMNKNNLVKASTQYNDHSHCPPAAMKMQCHSPRRFIWANVLRKIDAESAFPSSPRVYFDFEAPLIVCDQYRYTNSVNQETK